MNTRTLITLQLTLLMSGLAHSQEWTRFRGPNGQGKGELKGIPTEITTADYDWITKLDGYGHSSPVLWGGQIYLTTTNQPDTGGTERAVCCYHADTGDLVWRWTDAVESNHLHKFNNFATSTPVTDADGVYLVWASGASTQAIGLSHQGELLWRESWDGFTSDHGHGTSPVLVDGVLAFHTDAKEHRKSYVVAVNPADGEVLWNLERVTPEDHKKHLTDYNTPVTVGAAGAMTLVALQANDGWKGLDPKTGDVKWAAPGNYQWRTVGSVATDGTYLFSSFGSGGGGKTATTLKLNSGKAEVAYHLSMKDGLGYVPSPIIHDGHLYLLGDGGVFTCRRLDTGEEVFRERIGGNFFSSPILADGKFICGSRDGELVMLEAGTSFKILGRSRLDGGLYATPAVANGCLYLRTETHLKSICGQ